MSGSRPVMGELRGARRRRAHFRREILGNIKNFHVKLKRTAKLRGVGYRLQMRDTTLLCESMCPGTEAAAYSLVVAEFEHTLIAECADPMIALQGVSLPPV